MKHLLIMLLLLSGSANADVYKSINAEGDVVYSDTPTQGAEVMEMPELPTYTPPPVPEPVAGNTEPVEKSAYTSLVFVKPEDDATVRNNQGIINAELKLTPALRTRSNNRVQFYLDGEPYGAPGSSLRITMGNVDRGEHILTASVLDASGEAIISSDPVVVHLHRHTLNNPSQSRPTPR